jgi:RNA polymerase sigma-70 factor (ECF subfamily)
LANTLHLRVEAKTADEDERAALTEAEAVSTDAVRASKGDVEAFIRLYRGHLVHVYRYLYARLGHKPEAEDVTQQVFERAWLSVGAYRPVAGGSFRGWLFTIAHRALADHFRVGARGNANLALDTLAEELMDPALGPEETAILADQVRVVLRAIHDLPEDGREVITLRFMAELSYAEIARIVGKKEAAVKMAAYRALDTIRRKRRSGDV